MMSVAEEGPAPRRARAAFLWVAAAIGFSIPISTALDSLLVAGLLLLWVADGRYLHKLAAIRRSPLAMFSGAVFLLQLAGSAYSVAEPREILHALDKSSVLLLIPLLISLAPDDRDRWRALYAFLSAIALTLALSIAVWIELLPGSEFVKGVPQDPTVFKLHITHSVLVAYGAYAFAQLARTARRRHMRAMLIMAAAVAAFNVLFMVHGRTGQLVLLGLAVYFACTQFRWRGAIAVTASGVLLAGAVAYAPGSALHERVRTSIQEIRDWQAGKPVTRRNMRLESWSNSVQILRQNPVFGVGTGGFAAAYAEQVEGTSMLAVAQPENQYLLTAVQLGAVGLAALAALFALQWHQASRLSTATDTLLARGLVICMAVGCLFNSFLLDHTEALFYAWLSGMLYAGQRPIDRRI